jgi:hypothetical protein
VNEREYAAILRNNPQLVVKDQTNPPAATYTTRTIDYGVAARSVPTEHAEQVELFAWAERMQEAHPELVQLVAIPNGGYRPMTTAAKLKAEGVKAGYPDIILDVARGRWHGLRIELKRADHSNGPTAEQREWIERLRYYGYSAVVAYGAAEAQQVITAYLAQEG